MRHRLFVLLAALVPLAAPRAARAHAAAAKCTCDPKAGVFVIRYWPQDEFSALPREAAGAIDFFSLVKLDRPGGTDVVGSLTKSVTCRLGKESIEAVFEPLVPNVNLLGRCGADVAGSVTLKRDGKPLLPKQDFENPDCHEREKMIRTITVRAGGGKLDVETVGYDEE